MIGLLRRGDDGLTDRQRHRMAQRYARTLGAPDAAAFARARARAMTPVSAPAPLGLPLAGTGIDAATTVPTSAVVACTNAGRSAAQVGSHAVPATPGRGGKGAELASSPAVPGLVCDHTDPEEQRACLAEHHAVMARLADPDLIDPQE